MAEMKIDAIMKNLEGRLKSYEDLPWVDSYTENGSFRPDGPPEVAPSVQEIGKWLVIPMDIPLLILSQSQLSQLQL